MAWFLPEEDERVSQRINDIAALARLRQHIVQMSEHAGIPESERAAGEYIAVLELLRSLKAIEQLLASEATRRQQREREEAVMIGALALAILQVGVALSWTGFRVLGYQLFEPFVRDPKLIAIPVTSGTALAALLWAVYKRTASKHREWVGFASLLAAACFIPVALAFVVGFRPVWWHSVGSPTNWFLATQVLTTGLLAALLAFYYLTGGGDETLSLSARELLMSQEELDFVKEIRKEIREESERPPTADRVDKAIAAPVQWAALLFVWRQLRRKR